MNMDSKIKLKDKLRESTREAILDAAVAIMISNTADMRMEDIAEGAGIAIGTVYNYFENRQALVDTIIERRRSVADSYIRKSLDQTAGQHISARLENLFQTLFDFLERHRTVTHHSLQMKEINVNHSGKKSLMNGLNDYIMEMLQTALERDEIREEFMDVYPFVFSGYFRGVFAKVAEEQEVDIHPDVARKLAELFLNGAGKRAI